MYGNEDPRVSRASQSSIASSSSARQTDAAGRVRTVIRNSRLSKRCFDNGSAQEFCSLFELLSSGERSPAGQLRL